MHLFLYKVIMSESEPFCAFFVTEQAWQVKSFAPIFSHPSYCKGNLCEFAPTHDQSSPRRILQMSCRGETQEGFMLRVHQSYICWNTCYVQIIARSFGFFVQVFNINLIGILSRFSTFSVLLHEKSTQQRWILMIWYQPE